MSVAEAVQADCSTALARRWQKVVTELVAWSLDQECSIVSRPQRTTASGVWWAYDKSDLDKHIRNFHVNYSLIQRTRETYQTDSPCCLGLRRRTRVCWIRTKLVDLRAAQSTPERFMRNKLHLMSWGNRLWNVHIARVCDEAVQLLLLFIRTFTVCFLQ